MLSKITSAAFCGLTSYLVTVETDISQGMPYFDIVGYPGSEVKEAKERVRVALRNSGITLPAMRITVNLSPANLRKEGTALDLPIALGILTSLGHLTMKQTENMILVGELGLGGEIKSVRGILPMVMEAKEKGYTSCIVPYENVAEGAVVKGIQVMGASSLQSVLEFLQTDADRRKEILPPYTIDTEALLRQQNAEEIDFAEIVGQESAKRAAEIAAAGLHHLMFIGAPGTGKTMLAKRVSTILPDFTIEESLEVSKIYSVSGLLHPTQSLVTKRPFLNPHHTISIQALTGGGRIPRPGVMSLAHKGVLFLDELPEFGRTLLDVMRQPLEDKEIHIARQQGNYAFPADFMLVCAMNPCPCGYYPDTSKCRCSSYEVKKYLNRISGPLLDRIDIGVEVAKTDVELFSKYPKAESSAEIRARVIRARAIQRKRYEGTEIYSNASLTASGIAKYCRLGSKENKYMQSLCKAMDFSTRAYQRILKVARTIADIEGSEQIKESHIAEAVCYRTIDGKYWHTQEGGDSNV
ncbi:MAG: YifB family Mg chelatase-like AAA ATPase [Lachnospiraceae bacterium]|nr:YifB family Mg chelatase-like AAA ATPase [Lachnospiraceae bacterium]